MKKKKLFYLFIILLLININSFACDKTTLRLNSLIDNCNGTFTYNVYLCFEAEDNTAGPANLLRLEFPNSNAKILSIDKSTLTFTDGTTWSNWNGLGTNKAEITGTGIAISVTGDKECFNLSIVLDKNPGITGIAYKISIGHDFDRGGTCQKQPDGFCSSCPTPLSATSGNLPVISSQSTNSQTVCKDIAFNALSITATNATSYQWYSLASSGTTGGTPITVATSSTYTPPSSLIGTTYYYCIATNACGSVTSAASGAMNVNSLPAIPASTLTQPTCSAPTGKILITSPIGTGLNYNINGGTFQSNTTFSGLAANTYTIIAKDANGCTSTKNEIINSAPTVPSAPTTTLTQPTCAINTGTITVTAPLGAYTYSIDGVNFQGVTSFPGLVAANYTVTVKDATGCTATASAVLNNPPGAPAAASTTLTQPTCAINTGTITVTAPLGTYTYSIDGVNFQAVTSFPGLVAANYTVTVKDATGCTATASAVLNNPPGAPAAASTTLTQPTCAINTGTITVTAPLGVYTYSIDGVNFQAVTSFPGLVAANYTVTVKNGAGCTATASAVLNNPPGAPAAASTTLTQPTCAISTGTITVTAPIGAYTYSIDGVNFQSGTSFPVLVAANYTVTVKDGTGCTATASAVLNNPPGGPAAATTTITQPNCSIATGTITVTAPLGAYTYSIDGLTFQAGTSFPGLVAANYTVTVKDATGCTATASTVLNNPPGAPVKPSAVVKQPTCKVATGTITVTNPLGINYSYSLDNITFQSSPSFDMQTAGSYTYYVKDITECYSFNTTTIQAQPIIPIASFNYAPTELTTLSSETVFTNNSINATSFKWVFDDGSKISNVKNPTHLFPGNADDYNVKLTAYNKLCSHDTTVLVSVIEKPIIYVPNSFTPNQDELNNVFVPVIGGGISPENYSMYIFNRWGNLIFESHNKEIGWDGTFGNKPCPPDAYVWKIEYKESSGTKARKQLVGHFNLIN